MIHSKLLIVSLVVTTETIYKFCNLVKRNEKHILANNNKMQIDDIIFDFVRMLYRFRKRLKNRLLFVRFEMPS